MTPTVSVAMATYNGRLFLPEQLASLVAQHRRPDELVVRDDGSTDGTVELLEAFSNGAPFPVRISRNPSNMGVSATFQKAILECRGDIIFLCDQDDHWAPEKILRVVETFESHPSAKVVLNDKIIADAQLKPSNATMLGNMRGSGVPDVAFIAGCCSAHRREWLSVALPVPADVTYHDWWMIILAHQLGIARILDEPLQLYRRHGSNASVHPLYSERPLSRWDRLRSELSALRRDKRPALQAFWEKELHDHEQLARRIEDRQAELADLGLGRQAVESLARLNRRNHVARARIAVSKAPRRRRPAPIWRLWKSGGYRDFSGWKSAFKDLLQ
ncbi:MAG TPA: glycosyltransferase family 2 protein [Allosphingosinicella sp.]|nr:glycosyltransferase family 2 protein [Allosphingosinicella sp.]